MSSLILLFVLFIPVSGFQSVVSSFIHEPVLRGAAFHSSPFLLAARDLIMLLLYFLLAIKATKERLYDDNIGYIYCLLLPLTWAGIFALAHFNEYVLLAGLKSLVYFGTPLVMKNWFYSDPKALKKLTKALVLVFAIEILICTLQTQIMDSIEGQTIFGSRVIGSFNNPNTIGAYFALMIFYFLFLEDKILSKLQTFLVLSGCFCGVLMAGSRAAMLGVVSTAVFYFIRQKKNPKFLLALGAVTACVGLVFLTKVGSLAGRSGIPPIFKDPRWRMIFEMIERLQIKDLILGYGLGVRTNFAAVSAYQLPGQFDIDQFYLNIPESSLISLTSQVGLLGVTCYVAGFLILSKNTGTRGLALGVFTLILSFSNSIFEMYPIIFLIFTFYAILRFSNNVSEKFLAEKVTTNG